MPATGTLNDRNLADQLPSELLALVEKAPFQSLPSVIDSWVGIAGVRKSSKMVGTHWLMDILEIDEPRLLILTGALYLEHVAQRHIVHENFNRRRKPLAVEIATMANGNFLDDSLRDDLLAIVNLRNEFVHNLYYDISDWNQLASPFLAKNPPRMPARVHLRRAKKVVLVKILLMSILFRLHLTFPWLTFENVPKNRQKRSSRSSKFLHATAVGPTF